MLISHGQGRENEWSARWQRLSETGRRSIGTGGSLLLPYGDLGMEGAKLEVAWLGMVPHLMTGEIWLTQ